LGQRDQTDLLLDLENIGATYHTFPQFAAYTRETAEEDRFNEELRLVSKGAGRLGWIAGLFYNDYELDDTSDEFTPGFTDFVGIAPETGDLEFYQARRQTLTERAVFGEVSYDLTDRLQVAFGGRWFDYELAQEAVYGLPFIDVVDASQMQSDDDGFLGKVNASYAFTNGVTGYVTVSEGYRVGGANAVAPCPDPLPQNQQLACALPHEIRIDPDTTRNFEVGVHSRWNDGNLVFNGAVYQIDWNDIQTADVTANGQLWITANGGSAESRGVELALSARGLDGWVFTTSYAFNDAELTADAPGLVGGADAFSGDRLAGAPEHQGSFEVAHVRQLRSGWDLDVSYGFTATSDLLTKVGGRDNGETLGGYTVHHLSVGIAQDVWSAVVYADNLTDKFAESAVRLDPSVTRDVGGFTLRRYYRNVFRPRTVGVEFRYRFGD
jgi:outer membrane receptor protein involved in Fe transport